MKDKPVVIGMEVTKLGGADDGSPFRMTVDVFEDGTFKRYQVTGSYNGWPEGVGDRDINDIARVYSYHSKDRTGDQIAADLELLDRALVNKVQEAFNEHYRAQVHVLYGEEGLQLLDRESNERNGNAQ